MSEQNTLRELEELSSSLFQKIEQEKEKLAAAFNELAEEKLNWEQEKQAQEEAYEILHNKLQVSVLPERIQLDIGGSFFAISKNSLLEDDETFFAAMIGRYNAQTQSDERYFVDRDPFVFRYVLNYLRGLPVPYEFLSELEIRSLYDDACYYHVRGLIEEMEPLVDPWVLLMKGDGDVFQFNSEHWSTDSILNRNGNVDDFSPMKTDSFNNLAVQEIKLVAQGGNTIELRLPEKKTLLEYFSVDEVVGLEIISDEQLTPTELVNGTSFPFFDTVWRLNSKSPNAGIRIGGWYHKTWDKQYQTDQGGMPASAECAGVGIEDWKWSPFVYAKKSFGIRSAHDNPNNGGNISSAFKLYGKRI